MDATDCIFCEIASGQIPATKVYEDPLVVAFLDIAPVSDGHILVISKTHIDKFDECPPELMGQICSRLGRIASAVQKAVTSDGYNILCNNGRAAGQLVNHLHFHIIPRKTGDNVFDRWPAYQYPAGNAEKIADKIRNCL
jgi:histidine triad (HIT) family protein